MPSVVSDLSSSDEGAGVQEALSRSLGTFAGSSVSDLSSSDEGASVQEALSEITSQRTVPSVFVNRVHVGGCDHTFQVNSTVCF